MLASPGPSTSRPVLADLQRTAGNRAVVRLLDRQVAEGHGDGTETIRRAPLDTDTLVAKLDSIDFLKGKLAGLLRGETQGDTNAVDTRTQLKRAVTKYLARTGGNDLLDNAVMLSMALDGIAGVIAEELRDPWIKPKLATRLSELYQKELTAALTPANATKEQSTEARRTVAVAGVLATNDPVALYMHGELPIAEAARRIVFMASNASGALRDYAPAKPGDAAVTPTQMCALLRRRFEAQMLAYTRDDVKRRENLGRSNGSEVKSATRGTDDEVTAGAGGYSTR